MNEREVTDGVDTKSRVRDIQPLVPGGTHVNKSHYNPDAQRLPLILHYN